MSHYSHPLGVHCGAHNNSHSIAFLESARLHVSEVIETRTQDCLPPAAKITIGYASEVGLKGAEDHL